MKAPSKSKQIKLLPGIIIVAIQWVFILVFPAVLAEGMLFGIAGGVLSGLAFLIWWLFFSRAKLSDRWLAFGFMIITSVAVSFMLDKSITTANMGLMFPIFAIPVMCLAFILGLIADHFLSFRQHRITLLLAIILGSGVWIVLRTNGLDGSGRHDIGFRWAATPEKQLLQNPENISFVSTSNNISAEQVAEWPGFRGADRNSIVKGTNFSTSWTNKAPEELWRSQIGPGCSSFAVQGSLVYTQEQRGEYELVSCYELQTGKPVWQHRDSARFWDSHAGAGPRSTPALAKGYVYTLGGTGILNALDASNGSVIWTRNALEDTGVEQLTWGLAGSPIFYGNTIIVSVAGKLAAYNAFTGEPMWFGNDGGSSYSSPHLIKIDGIDQVMHMSNAGAVSHHPISGANLWTYSWQADGRILQPALISNGDLLLAAEAKSLRRIVVSYQANEWSVQEKWTSTEMRLNFNDMVIHKGYAYGFHGPNIACIDLENGKRQWKGDRYQGWILLLADQNILLVVSEKGELAIVEANPEEFKELGRIKAIEGKTWNHPVLVDDILLVRNSVEMAAYRLQQSE